MTRFLVAAVLFASVGSAMACDQQEAQFIGLVKNYSAANCSFEIEYSMFNPSYVCPLVPGEVSSLKFTDAACGLKNGDQVSGVLVKKDDSVVIE